MSPSPLARFSSRTLSVLSWSGGSLGPMFASRFDKCGLVRGICRRAGKTKEGTTPVNARKSLPRARGSSAGHRGDGEEPADPATLSS